MSLYWILECIPYAITSLLPVVLYPLFGIMSSKQITSVYFQVNYNLKKNNIFA